MHRVTAGAVPVLRCLCGSHLLALRSSADGDGPPLVVEPASAGEALVCEIMCK